MSVPPVVLPTLCVQAGIPPVAGRWVAPFGHLRITVCKATSRSISQPCHALHRLLAPRHPPYTLITLTTQPPTLLARTSLHGVPPDAVGSRRSVSSEDTRHSSRFTCQRASGYPQRAPTRTSYHTDVRAVNLGFGPLFPLKRGGDERTRTANLSLAKAALSQLSYIPPPMGRPDPWWA